MFIKIIANETVNIDNKITLENTENTINIKNIENLQIKGFIRFTNTTIIYDLVVECDVEFENHFKFGNKLMHLTFSIIETDEINEENPHIIKKTLDLQAKIWENIVVEIFTLVADDKSVSGRDVDNVCESQIDDRLSPLLQLLNTNEEV